MIEDDRGTLRAVAWSELFPWLLLFRCFRISIGLRPLLLSSIAALVTILGWSLIGLFFSGNAEIAAQHSACNGCPWNALVAVADSAGAVPWLQKWSAPGSADLDGSISYRNSNPIVGTWEHLSRPFRQAFSLNLGPGREFQASRLAYSLLCALWALVVWALAGGAVTRAAAVQLACGERVGWGGMIGYAKARWRAYAWAPLFPFLFVLVGVLLIAVFGLLLMRWNLGLLVAGIVWPLVLAGGFLMVLLLAGLAFGWPLMFATISTEGTDSFDALSRSYAYVFQRPLHYFFYAVLVTVVGILGWLVVFGFAQTLIGLTQGAACWGSGGQFAATAEPAVKGAAQPESKQETPRPVPASGVFYKFSNGDSPSHVGWLGDLLIRIWSDCVRLLAVGYLYSYFWVSASGIYLLLRRDVDDTEIDEVYLEDAGGNDAASDLPEIGKDEAGAPVVNGEKPLSETE